VRIIVAESTRQLGKTFVVVVAVRLLPIAPFFTVLNVIAGASHIRLRQFLLGWQLLADSRLTRSASNFPVSGRSRPPCLGGSEAAAR